MNAPMHVWKTPKLNTPGAVSVAVAPVGGDTEVAEHMNQSLVATRPQTMTHLAILFPDQLERVGGIQLVSYDGQPSEMATFGAAKRAGAQYVLSGEIMQHDLEPREPLEPSLFNIFRQKPPDESMTIRWTVFDAKSGLRLGENTITMNRRQAEQDYPDLAYSDSIDGKIISASARRSWELVIPTTHATQATLDLPWFMPGSSSVRKGNAYAKLGQWNLAEREWQEAADLHPWNRAAWNNLSLAAVANEDFQLARNRLRHAELTWLPGRETAKTEAWIDSLERDYQSCFNPAGAPPMKLPRKPPYETVPYGPVQSQSVTPASLPTSEVKPRSLDDQPWYTVIPFVPPPGWTWKDWWYQSTLF